MRRERQKFIKQLENVDEKLEELDYDLRQYRRKIKTTHNAEEQASK